MSLMLEAPSAIAAATETSTIPRPSSGDVPFFRSATLSQPVSPAWSTALRSRTCAGGELAARDRRPALRASVRPGHRTAHQQHGEPVRTARSTPRPTTWSACYFTCCGSTPATSATLDIVCELAGTAMVE